MANDHPIQTFRADFFTWLKMVKNHLKSPESKLPFSTQFCVIIGKMIVIDFCLFFRIYSKKILILFLPLSMIIRSTFSI